MAAVPGPQLSQPSLHREAIGLNEQFSGMNEQVRRLFFLDRPVGETFRHISGVNCPFTVAQRCG
jgi:hypothetical protein